MRCRWCYNEGHNQRTCPVKTDHFKKRAEANPDSSYWQERYQERISPQKRAGKCGYCEEVGHTRRKCETLEKDIKFCIENHRNRIRVAGEYLQRTPIGMGSMFRYSKTEWYPVQKKKKVDLVMTEIDVRPDYTTELALVAKGSSFIDSGHDRLFNYRRYVRDPRANLNSSWSVYLVSPCTNEFDIEAWVQKQLETSPDRVRSMFKRTGRKREDVRPHHLRRREERIEIFQTLDKHHRSYEDYRRTAHAHLYGNIRTEALRDFDA